MCSLNDFKGEDWYFCEKLEAAGIPIFVDHEASSFIGHIGNKVYTHDDVLLPENKPGENETIPSGVKTKAV